MGKDLASGIYLQDRDVDLLRTLLDSRIATSAHIAALHFESKESAKKRLQKLKAAELIGERERKVNDPSVLFLTAKALKLLKDSGNLPIFPELPARSLERRSRVSELTVRHELAVMDVKASFHRAFRRHNYYSITHFSTWPALHKFKAQRPPIAGSACRSTFGRRPRAWCFRTPLERRRWQRGCIRAAVPTNPAKCPSGHPRHLRLPNDDRLSEACEGR